MNKLGSTVTAVIGAAVGTALMATTGSAVASSAVSHSTTLPPNTRADMRRLPARWTRRFDAVVNLFTSFGFNAAPGDEVFIMSMTVAAVLALLLATANRLLRMNLPVHLNS